MFVQIKSDEFPAIEISIIGSGDKRLRDNVADLLKSEIEDLDAVKDVRMIGYREREFTIELDLRKMDLLHIGIPEVLGKLQARNISIPGGDVEQGAHKDLVRLDAKFRSSTDLDDLVIRSSFTGQLIKLSDFAKVTDGAEDPRTLASYQGSLLLI